MRLPFVFQLLGWSARDAVGSAVAIFAASAILINVLFLQAGGIPRQSSTRQKPRQKPRGRLTEMARPPPSCAAALGLAESAVLGAFCAQDLALFVAFFDLMLIPFYFLIGMWGTGDRVRATTKLVVYTLVGSFFMLAGAIATGVLASSQHGTNLTFVISSLQHLPLSHASQNWIFLCFAVAFLVKMPRGPVPRLAGRRLQSDADPGPGRVLGDPLQGRRVRIPAHRPAAVPVRLGHFQTLMLLIALVSILWGTSLAFTTTDARLVVAYSSIAQLSFITLGIFSLRPQGAQGALLQMVNHALVTAPMFFIVAASWPSAPAARRTFATWAGSHSAHRSSPRCS